MSWPATTWVTGELVTATKMNAYVRDPIAQMQSRAIAFGIGDASGDVIAVGSKGSIEVPFACTIAGWTILAEQVGSIVIDVWKTSYAAAPPTVANTIAGSEKPTLSAANKNQDLVLTTWTPGINAGDVLKFNVDSVTTIKQATVTLRALLA